MPSSKSSVDNRDVYYRLGKSAGYRARSAYKLVHLDEEFGLFRGVATAVDLCAAPGSWTQVLSQAIKPGRGQDDPKVVSVDLQPMAPLPNTTILQTDITLPSTIPLVLRALGARKADLVVCDGAPDVTGVHDLDAYLHSQLLLAAITLSLTLLAPHATLIFKIFLSPLDPQAAILRSQLECFFPGRNVGPAYSEFDDFEEDDPSTNLESLASVQISQADELSSDDNLSKGGVWVRKPRSSRKGSGEAFIVCRNFDPSKVPLPITFSPDALQDLEQQTTGTLTLESLAHLGSVPIESCPEWDAIKAYVGSGDLDLAAAHSSLSKTLSHEHDRLTLQLSPNHSLSRDSSIRSIRDLHAHPTPRDELDEYFGAYSSYGDSLSPTKVGLGIKRNGSTRRPRVSSIASTASTGTSPGGTSFFASLAAQERLFEHRLSSIPTPRRFDSSDSKDWDLFAIPPRTDGQPSPALSTASKTDAFFATSPTESNLPLPPKPVGRVSSIGHGWPATEKGHDRAISMPTFQVERPERQSGSPSLDIYLQHRQTPNTFEPENPTRIAGGTFTEQPLPRLPPLTDISGVAGGSEPSVPTVPLKRPLRQQVPREPQQFLREQREAPVDSAPFQNGDVLVPVKGDRQWPVEASPRRWVLTKRLGEGAFSAVWEANELSPAQGTTSKLAAVKVTSRAVCQANSRTRIAFLREVSVLRHISHPNIVAFLQSFSTSTHHCLVLERVTGGELFELLTNESNRKRLLLPCPDDPAGEGLVRRIFSEIVRAVGWLHEVNVVHRDIKLENTMFTANPFALTPTPTNSVPLAALPSPLIKIIDFGLSRFIDPTLPMLQTRCGSESYAAPEIIMGRKYDGRSTDAWAIGVLLYALVAGELPFEGRDEEGRSERSERKRRMMRIAKGQYTWPAGAGHKEVRKLVSRLLVRDPDHRASVNDLWDDGWMRGPGEIEPPTESNGHVIVGKTKCKRVLDGFLLDEEVEAEALAEET